MFHDRRFTMNIIKTTLESFVAQCTLYTPLFKESVKSHNFGNKGGTLHLLYKY